MRNLLQAIFLSLAATVCHAQISDSIMATLQSANKLLTSKGCTSIEAAAISDKAMNMFLADKTGYLSESTDLSFYTNYVTLNSSEGKLVINHNFQNANGKSEAIQKLFSIGISINLSGRLQQAFLNRRYENELGITVGYKWLGKVRTRFADCSQKRRMDALRAAILHSVETEVRQQEADFKKSLNTIDSTTVPGQHIADAKLLMLKKFKEELEATYTERFARMQAETLTSTKNFGTITTHWTSLTAYIPVLAPTYPVALSISTPFQKEQSYPAGLLISHTRLWENSKKGRLFVTLSGRAFLNNAKLSYTLSGVTPSDYKNLGGIDSIYTSVIGKEEIYLGHFTTFITPSLQVRLVYFPSVSHVGFSFLIEQNFGTYHFFNGRLGVPIVLINSKKLPAANLEFYVLFTDISGQIEAVKKFRNRPAIGLNIGMPFSRLMF